MWLTSSLYTLAFSKIPALDHTSNLWVGVYLLLMLPPACVLSDLPSRGLNHEGWFKTPRLKVFAKKYLILDQTMFFVKFATFRCPIVLVGWLFVCNVVRLYGILYGFWFLDCHSYGTTLSTLPSLHQERIHVVHSNKVAGSTWPEDTPTMDLGLIHLILKWCVCMFIDWLI